jgi:hypothetical protein
MLLTKEIKIIKIHNCGECPSHRYGSYSHICSYLLKPVVLKRIRKDCPLENYWDAI